MKIGDAIDAILNGSDVSSGIVFLKREKFGYIEVNSDNIKKVVSILWDTYCENKQDKEGCKPQ